jgi:hypothetical protein
MKALPCTAFSLGFVLALPASAEVVRTELAGETLAAYPFFHYVRSFGPRDPVEIGLDPSRFPQLAGSTCDLWIVADRSAEHWGSDRVLVDVRAYGPQPIAITGSTIEPNRRKVASAGELDSDAGPGLGVGYDLVLDCDRDDTLSDGDLIDGHGDEAGLYAVHDTVEPGPLPVARLELDEGPFLAQRIFHPAALSDFARLPLVVVSHGWTLDHTQYDYLGEHLASYGYLVLVHENDTGFGDGQGTLRASTTTLTNTDHLITHQATLGGGLLAGHIDAHNIVFVGHSTGGEGVVRAYTRLYTGDFVPQSFGVSDVVLVSSMGPVSFHPANVVSPHAVNYHQFLGAADTDTANAPIPTFAQPISIYERGTGNRQLGYIHGVGHGWFNEPPSPDWAEGPNLIGRAATHEVLRGYYLPLVELYTRGNPAATDFFTRTYTDFHPAGIDANVVMATEYRDGAAAGNFVIDDFQTESDTGISSSGGAVSSSVANVAEVLMGDLDSSFDWTGAQPSNGLTRARFPSDDPRCVVFDWNGAASFYELEVVPAERDFADDEYLSFRAAQGTRHPETDALDAPLSFSVTLRDGGGATSTIDFDVLGRLTRPYERTGFGSGVGWANEFQTVRIRLEDFGRNGSDLDLGDVVAVRFDFGPGFGSPRGRIGLDDVEVVRREEEEPLRFERLAGGELAITWPAVPGALHYNVYRGTIPADGLRARGTGFAVYDHVCHESADATGDGARRSHDDASPPPPGVAGFYYLISAVGASGEATLGHASVDLDPSTPGDQLRRPNAAPCP